MKRLKFCQCRECVTACTAYGQYGQPTHYVGKANTNLGAIDRAMRRIRRSYSIEGDCVTIWAFLL